MDRTFLIWRRDEDNEVSMHFCSDKKSCRELHAEIPPSAFRITNDHDDIHNAIRNAMDEFCRYEKTLKGGA